MVSQVATPEEALRIARACKYHPDGNRGLAPYTRIHGYSDENIAEKLRAANDQTFASVLVEGQQGIDNLEKIAAVPGLDMIYLGIFDMSQAVGVPVLPVTIVGGHESWPPGRVWPRRGRMRITYHAPLRAENDRKNRRSRDDGEEPGTKAGSQRRMGCWPPAQHRRSVQTPGAA